MADAALVGLYLVLSVSQALAMTLSVYFAYQITRLTGTFWAWSLLIVAFGLFALRDFTSVVSIFEQPVDQLSALTDQFTLTSVWPGTIVNEAAYLSLMVATFGLNRIFTRKRLKEKAWKKAASASMRVPETT